VFPNLSLTENNKNITTFRRPQRGCQHHRTVVDVAEKLNHSLGSHQGSGEWPSATCGSTVRNTGKALYKALWDAERGSGRTKGRWLVRKLQKRNCRGNTCMAKMNTWGAPMLTTIKVRGLAGA
jgi:hypothetical protein